MLHPVAKRQQGSVLALDDQASAAGTLLEEDADHAVILGVERMHAQERRAERVAGKVSPAAGVELLAHVLRVYLPPFLQRVVGQVGIVGLRIGREKERRIGARSEEHTSELQSLMRISYAVFCLKKKQTQARYQN